MGRTGVDSVDGRPPSEKLCRNFVALGIAGRDRALPTLSPAPTCRSSGALRPGPPRADLAEIDRIRPALDALDAAVQCLDTAARTDDSNYAALIADLRREFFPKLMPIEKYERWIRTPRGRISVRWPRLRPIPAIADRRRRGQSYYHRESPSPEVPRREQK